MHAGTLVKIAAELAVESGTLIQGSRQVPEKSLEQYWIASRCRLQRWQIDLKTFEVDLRNHPDRFLRIWLKAEPLMNEVLQSEVLTRVWSAILNGIEQVCPVRDCDPIGRSTLIGHLEARNRVLQLVLDAESKQIPAVHRMNEMRTQTERWTDFLISMIAEHADVASFGFDEQRIHEFCKERSYHPNADHTNTFDAVSLAALNDFYHRTGCRSSTCTYLNQTLARSVLGAIDSNLFRESGIIMPLWQTRMLVTTNETYGAVEELLRQDLHADSTQSSFSSRF